MEVARHIYNPFRIDIDPMERLLLVNFEKDPDGTYVGFEPQVFDDPVNGSGHLVIGWRVDGKIDVYHQESLRPDPGKYDIAGKGLANIAAVEFEEARFEVGPAGLQVRYAFADLQGRRVALHIHERHPRPRKPFGLLAPMGMAAAAPSAMPLVMLHDFYFVRKKHTHIEVRIAGREHRPDELPVPMDFTRMYFSRYSPRPLIATFNPAMNGPLPVLDWDGESPAITWEGHEVTPEYAGERPGIREIVRHNAVHPVRLVFEPPFPHLETLAPGDLKRGGFRIEAHPDVGSVAGTYELLRDDNAIHITLRPSGGWRPKISKPSLWLIYTAAKIFKQWPKTYEWNARVILHPGGRGVIQSAWKRIQSLKTT